MTAVAIWLTGAVSAAALECPVAHGVAGAGVLRETPQAIANLHSTLVAKGSAAAPQIVASLQERHPDAGKGEIGNYLITAYCPVVNARSDMTETAKRAELKTFRAAVSRLLYR